MPEQEPPPNGLSRRGFICPCHGSRYDADGAVVKGPTKKGLYAWEARVEPQGIVISGEAPAIRL